MKNAIIGATMLIVICLMVLIHSSISAENIRQNELDQSLSWAARTTMEVAKKNDKYKITTEDEFLTEFNRNLLSRIHTDSDIEVQVIGCNLEEGFLDVKAISKFKYPTGAPGQVESRKSVIFDETEKNASSTTQKNPVTYTSGNHSYNYTISNEELIAYGVTNFSDSNQATINATFSQGKIYTIEIEMYDTNNMFYNSLSGNIILDGVTQTGVWTTEGNKNIYRFIAENNASTALLFDGGFYVQANKVTPNYAFGSLKIFEE